jgi:hypothetical protein
MPKSRMSELLRHASVLAYRMPIPQSDPDGIRTRVTALKGPCPRPLDDGATSCSFSGHTRDQRRIILATCALRRILPATVLAASSDHILALHRLPSTALPADFSSQHQVSLLEHGR